MREILFRGKDVNSNEWRIGYFYTAVQGCVAIIGDGVDGYQVKPETVGQYTESKDKNGNKIFEGDIVQNVTNGKTAVVQWFSEHNAFMLWCKSKNQVYWLYDNNFSNIEVIGNIYDDPELLK